jgi:N-acyl-D-aspartate/D-glutamate deacylase
VGGPSERWGGMPDVVIRGGLVADGTGVEPYRADVAISQDRIVAVGVVGPAETTIDASGLFVSPGFIDIHTHSDFTIPNNPWAHHAVRQGVTTEVVGNCGFSLGPVSDRFLPDYAELVTPFGVGLDWSWRSGGDALAALERARPAQNVVPLVGHGTVRTAVVGLAGEAATAGMHQAMLSLAEEAVAAGYWGISSGLIYPPGVDADEREIAAVAAPFRHVNGIYATHMRDESDGLLQSIEESIRTAAAAGLRLQVSHLKAVGRRNWGKVAAALDLLDEARNKGSDVNTDFYPYEAVSTFLSSVLPPWVNQGGVRELLARLRSGEVRDRLRAELDIGHEGWWNPYRMAEGWDQILVASVTSEGNRSREGQSVAEAARARAADPFDFVCDLLIEEQGAALMAAFVVSQADLDRLAACPYAAIGSDSVGVVAPGKHVHPRAYGSFARFLSEYARERAVVSWGDAIRRVTMLPASIMGLSDRGRISRGMAADLVLLDPATVRDRASYANPDQPPDGIHHVLVAGRMVIDGGVATNERPGHVLTKERPPGVFA